MLRSEASNSIYTVFPLPDKSSNKEFIHPDAPCVMYPMGWERSYSFGGLVLNSKAPLEIHARYLNDKIAVFYAKTQQSEDISKSFIIAVFRDMSQAEMGRSHTYRYWKGFEHRVTLKYLQAFPELLVYLKQ